MAMKITLLDYCSEKNRGDAAIQQAIIRHIKKNKSGDLELNIITVFGNNEQDKMLPHFDHSLQEGVRLLGGIKPTFYSKKLFGHANILFTEVMNFAGVFFAYAYILMIYLGFPHEFIKILLTNKNVNTFEVINNSDLIFLKGRNYRSRNHRVLEIIRTASQLYNGFMASALDKKIILVGGSFWQLSDGFSKSLIIRLLRKCELIGVRESFSEKLIRELLPSKMIEKIRLIPDLGFSAFEVNFLDNLREKKHSRHRNLIKVGVVLMSWKTDGENIYKNYLFSVRNFILTQINLGAMIFFIPQVEKEWESDDEAANAILAKLTSTQRRNVVCLKKDLMINDLISIYNNMDFVLTTRMHAAIFSVLTGTPTISISYDSGAKWETLTDIGFKQFVCPISEVSSERLELMSSDLRIKFKDREKNMHEILEYYPAQLDRFFEESLHNS